MVREGFVEGGPFYRGQTQNALFIARSGWQFIEFPLKAKELRSRAGTRATRGAFVGNGRGGRVKWYLFSFLPLCTFSRVYTHSLTIENFPFLLISIFFILTHSHFIFYIQKTGTVNNVILPEFFFVVNNKNLFQKNKNITKNEKDKKQFY